ncbi:MAG: hypothetical protein AAB364_02350 [Patescibacteria group bacterium]
MNSLKNVLVCFLVLGFAGAIFGGGFFFLNPPTGQPEALAGASEATLAEQTKQLVPGDFIYWKAGGVSVVTELKGEHIITREFNGGPRYLSADRIADLAHHIAQYERVTHGSYALTTRDFLGVKSGNGK